ncbi:DUF6660 family protein [Flavobacterium sp.]|uniref:DUF6660 family protein n=1 Tax=Flavobacterium sp. TaxID=239 RepID=UPI0037500C5D
MRLLKYILSIYLVALSCLPCADMEVNSFAHSSPKIAANHENHSHDKENDLCPPFCVCNCCGQQILNFSKEVTFEFRKIATEITTQIPNYKSIPTSNFYGSIWQPPQIV